MWSCILGSSSRFGRKPCGGGGQPPHPLDVSPHHDDTVLQRPPYVPPIPNCTATSCTLNRLYRGVSHQPAKAVKRVPVDGFDKVRPSSDLHDYFRLRYLTMTSLTILATNLNLFPTCTNEDAVVTIFSVPSAPFEESSYPHSGQIHAGLDGYLSYSDHNA